MCCLQSLIRERRLTVETEVEPEPVKSPPSRRAIKNLRRASFHRTSPLSSPNVKTEVLSPAKETSPQPTPLSPKNRQVPPTTDTSSAVRAQSPAIGRRSTRYDLTDDFLFHRFLYLLYICMYVHVDVTCTCY